jgi:hypothetical protein
LASIQPLIADVRYNPDTGAPVYEPWPVLMGVKVLWPQSGSFVSAGNLKAHDQVTLEAYDYDPSGIAQPGAQVVNPADIRKLGGNYWRARPDSLSVPLSAKDAAAAAAGGLVGIPNDPAQMQFVPGGIKLGAAAAQPVALAGGTAGVDAFIAALYKLFTSGWTPVPNDGGAALKAAFTLAFPAPPATTGAAIVKAQ